MSLDYLNKIGQAREAIKTIADTPVGKVAHGFAESALDDLKENVPTSQSGTGPLKESLGIEFSSDGKSISIKFLAEDYWDYVNSGVDGVRQSAGATQNQFGSVYSFKTENPSYKMVEAIKGGGGMQNWLAAKGITSMTYGGETHQLVTDSDYRGAAYVIARAVKRHGIEPSHFVDKAFTEQKLAAFEEAIIDAFASMI